MRPHGRGRILGEYRVLEREEWEVRGVPTVRARIGGYGKPDLLAGLRPLSTRRAAQHMTPNPRSPS